MRLIDGDRLLEHRRIGKYYHLPNGDIAIPLIDIEHAPSIDAVQVIRCKECKYYKENTMVCSRYGLEDDDYCSWAERKEP